jgi:hypothetical protein
MVRLQIYLSKRWRIWVQATISMLRRKVELIIERIPVHASFVTIYIKHTFSTAHYVFVPQGDQLKILGD